MLDYLTNKALNNEIIDNDKLEQIFTDKYDLIDILYKAYIVRKKKFNNNVRIHILNNIKNGSCSENCKYCAQSCVSTAPISVYDLKSDEEILSEAKLASKNKAYRYCMVLSGKDIDENFIEHACKLITKIRQEYKIEVCLSAGKLTVEQAKKLKIAGLNRYNHNLNTSSNYYGRICTSHTYMDRLKTIEIAKNEGLEICSGLIVGMGETISDIVEVAQTLKKYNVESIPINFYIHIEGNELGKQNELTVEYCLKVLSLFRFCNPNSEIRVAAGREIYLAEHQNLALLPANSLFCNGYLNTDGASVQQTVKMIKGMGFVVESVE